MADKTFDVVIAGGGNKALVTAMYLTKYGGLKVGIFEDGHEVGGGWSSEEPVGGYIANTCSTEHTALYHTLVLEDFPEFEDYGARFSYTGVSLGDIFEEDNSCVLVYNCFDDVDPTQEKTAQQIARFSEKDAETWLFMWSKWQKYWKPAVEEWLWTPAQPFGTPDALDRLIQNPDSGIDPLWLSMSPLQVYKDIFESIEMQNFPARINQAWGFQTDLPGSGIGVLFFMMMFPYLNFIVGGTHQLAHAAQRIVIENGGEVFTKHPVKKIVIENGTAKGIILNDGTRIEATKAVISNVDPYQLCFDLIGEEHLSSKIKNRVKNIERDWITISWYTWMLKERPIHKAAGFNPDIDRCMGIVFGNRDLNTLLKETSERKALKWPTDPCIMTVYHGGKEDDLLAPQGNDFNVLTEAFILPAFSLSSREWKEMEKRHAEEVIKKWEQYAPNMTWDNVIGYNPVTPYYTANQCKNYAPAGNWCVIDNIPSQFGRTRPIPELAGHRMPIKSLYATGSAWHPYG
ncbi:MAG: NAD(P)/FAD-dependent oxidoreductase, partial [Deltaproteobacteria bacterium]|nr:NAD(P)/FAD-dependent oxidoreductase [Deltaproteobacteria bacterium]